MIKNFKQEIKNIWKQIEQYDSIVLCTHIDPDGDTLGSAFALKHLIKSNFNDKKVYISGANAPRYLSFLGQVDQVSDLTFAKSLIIVVDTSNKRRIHDKRVITENSIKIDHHTDEENWKLKIGGDHWPATGEVIFEIASQLDLKMTEQFNDAIFVAIWTDTDGLTLREPSARTIEIANLCSANKDEILKKIAPSPSEQTFINNVLKDMSDLKNVSYVVINEIIPNDIHRNLVSHALQIANKESLVVVGINERGMARMSIRTKTNFDLSIFCKQNGGGGHKQSGGITRPDEDEAMKIIELLDKELNEKL